MTDPRSLARKLAARSIERGDPCGWFEELYSRAAGDAANIPWADLRPEPILTAWLDRERVEGDGRRALEVGCGLGDGSQELERRGFDVTAFDVSASAIEWCRERWQGSAVRYGRADLLALPEAWLGAFDFVFECFTLQSLPADVRGRALEAVASLVAPGGTLLVIARGRGDDEPAEIMPWPLSRSELAAFERAGLELQRFEDFLDDEVPAVRRFRATYRRPRES